MGTPAQDALAIARGLSASEESYYLEFKSAWQYGADGKLPRPVKEIARDVGEAIVAFANAEGGDLLIGVEDDGAVTGIPHEDERVRYLQAWQQQVRTSDGAYPPVRVFSVELDGHQVVMFRVEAHAGAPLVTSDGRCMMRQGAASNPVSPGEIERRRAHHLGDRDYESRPVPEASLEDLDLELIRRSRGRMHRKTADSFDDVAVLRYWNLVEQRNGSVVLRRAALLLFARNALRWHPNNRVRLRYVLGDEAGYGRRLRTREREFLGPILQILEDASSTLQRELERENRQEQLFTTSQLLPPEAVDECLVNAVAHRNYAIEGQAIEIQLHPDRVEFHSPGRLPDPITIEDLESERGVHRSRNPVMMRVLRDIGWTRDQGEGMARIFGSMRQVELHEPQFEEMADTFKVRLSTRSVYDPATQAWISAYGPYGLQPEERRYMVALRKAGGMLSVDRLARKLGESFDDVERVLSRLERRHLVWHPKRSRSYRLVAPLNVLHERALRALEHAKLRPSREIVLGRQDIARAARATDEEHTSEIIGQWKQAGVLRPAGSKTWRLGDSFLTYLEQRAE